MRFSTTQSTLQKHRWQLVMLAMLVALALLTMLALTVQAAGSGGVVYGERDMRPPQGSEDAPQFEIFGIVIAAPDNANGIGEWKIRSRTGADYIVIAHPQTRFDKGIPQTNDSVRVRGRLQGGASILAERIERLNRQEGDDIALRGILLSAPSAPGIGAWVIRTGPSLTLTVIVNSETRLDDGIPNIGERVAARGRWQADNTFLAFRVRIDAHELNQIVVRLAAGVAPAVIAARYNLQVDSALLASGNLYLFKTVVADEERIVLPRLKADPDVLWAELNLIGGIPEEHGYKVWHWGGQDDTGYINQSAFAQVNLNAALSAASGKDVIVAVLDTGVDFQHPALQNHLLSGWDMIDDDNDPQEQGDGLGVGHGTHVIGIIAQMAPDSRILPVRVLDSDGRGNMFTLAYAIEWAAAQGADVINLSLGAESDSYVLHEAVQKAVEQGVVIVAAAGNTNSDIRQYPAGYPNVLSVTAVDGANFKADFANYGHNWVDLAAPGVGITSTFYGPEGSGYASWSGTSMATSFVSGAVALARQKFPSTNVGQFTALFSVYAQDIDTLNPGYVDQLGGLLDTGGAVTAAALPAAPPQTNVLRVYLPLVAGDR